MLERFAVMGNPIDHSLSPQIHQAFAKQVGCELVYDKIFIEKGTFSLKVKDFFSAGGQGLNVTLPFKEEAYHLAAVKTSRCEQAKSANTLWWRDSELYADNTDGIGLIRDLTRHIDLTDKRVLVLGAGGAARGIMGPLLEASIASLSVMNRTKEKLEPLRQDFPMIQNTIAVGASFDLIINATSLGQYQSVWDWPLEIDLKEAYCYDLSYAQDGNTPFVNWVMTQGAAVSDGLGMLVEQAAESFYIWHGIYPETSSIISFLRLRNE